MTNRRCSIDGCERPLIARGWCHTHYKRWQVHGDPMADRLRTAPTFERLVLIETDDHVVWPLGLDSKGYGQMSIDGREVKAHTLALERHEGPRPSWAVGALHNPGCPRHCMNHRHLRWGTQKENIADRVIDGTDAQGVRNGRARLTEDQVREIRSRCDAGEVRIDLAREFGVGQTTVEHIFSRKNWGWLE